MGPPGRALDRQSPLIPWWPRPSQPTQGRLVRIPPRGPARVALLIGLTLGWVALAGSMVLAALGTEVAVALIAGAVLATVTVWVLRSWSVGTYVNDDGFVVRRTFTTRSGRWTEVTGIAIGPRRVRIAMAEHSISTHLARWSLDNLGSSQSYEMASDQFMRWYLEQ